MSKVRRFHFNRMSDVIDECVADYDYGAEAAVELSFKKGDLLLIYEKNARSGWWDGSRPDGRRGFIPSNYVSPRAAPLPLAAKPQLYVCETRYDAEEANELTILVGDRVKVLKKNLETGWWLGQSSRGKGWIPGEFVVPL